MTCIARRELDEMVCTRCRLRWDVNDSEPMPCPLTVPPHVRTPPLVPDQSLNCDACVPRPRYASGLPFLNVDSTQQR